MDVNFSHRIAAHKWVPRDEVDRWSKDSNLLISPLNAITLVVWLPPVYWQSYQERAVITFDKPRHRKPLLITSDCKQHISLPQCDVSTGQHFTSRITFLLFSSELFYPKSDNKLCLSRINLIGSVTRNLISSWTFSWTLANYCFVDGNFKMVQTGIPDKQLVPFLFKKMEYDFLMLF